MLLCEELAYPTAGKGIMEDKNDKLSVTVDGMAVITAFGRELANRGVLFQRLRELTNNPQDPRWDEIAGVIMRPVTRLQELSAEYGVLAEKLMPERVTALVKGLPNPTQMSRFYIEPSRLDQLLSRLRGPEWRRAAIVMAYGLGTDGHQYTRSKIAHVLSLSKGVGAHLEARRLSGELLGLHRDLERTLEPLSDRGLPQDTLQFLEVDLWAKSVPTVGLFTRQEVERVFQDLARTRHDITHSIDQVLADLAKAGISLYPQ